MNEKEVYEKLIEKFGKDAQLFMVVEEMAELQQAISKYMRFGNRDNVLEEIVDVEIMLEQLKMMLGIDESELENIKERKMEKLEQLASEYTFQEGIKALCSASEKMCEEVMKSANEFAKQLCKVCFGRKS